jgi:hypothetical protein
MMNARACERSKIGYCRLEAFCMVECDSTPSLKGDGCDADAGIHLLFIECTYFSG